MLADAGGQGPEPDPCFGTVVAGREVLQQLHKKLGNEWLNPKEFVKFNSVTVKAV